MIECDHQEATDPRRAGSCLKCGRVIPQELQRDPELEKEIIRKLLAGSNYDPEPLIVYAQRRANAGAKDYGTDFPDLQRNLGREGADESADGVNYPTWWLCLYHWGLIPESEHWKAEHMQKALRYSALAFAEFHAAV